MRRARDLLLVPLLGCALGLGAAGCGEDDAREPEPRHIDVEGVDPDDDPRDCAGPREAATPC